MLESRATIGDITKSNKTLQVRILRRKKGLTFVSGMDFYMQRLVLALLLLGMDLILKALKAHELVKLVAMHGFDCPPVSGCQETSKIKGTVLLKAMGASRSLGLDLNPRGDLILANFQKSQEILIA
jgi:hypothetical protein